MNKILSTLAVSTALFGAVTTSMAAPHPIRQDDMAMKTMSMKSMAMMTSSFKGPEVNGGTASLVKEGNKNVIRLSSDFKIPAAPAPHFQVVDSEGNVFLLQRLTVVGDKTHREVTLPKYIHSVAKVQIWCAFAEVVLGEASFAKPIRLGR